MTNVERIKQTIRENSRYGLDEEIQRLTIENAVTLAAIADALEELTEHIRKMAGGGMSDLQEW